MPSSMSDIWSSGMRPAPVFRTASSTVSELPAATSRRTIFTLSFDILPASSRENASRTMGRVSLPVSSPSRARPLMS